MSESAPFVIVMMLYSLQLARKICIHFVFAILQKTSKYIMIHFMCTDILFQVKLLEYYLNETCLTLVIKYLDISLHLKLSHF